MLLSAPYTEFGFASSLELILLNAHLRFTKDDASDARIAQQSNKMNIPLIAMGTKQEICHLRIGSTVCRIIGVRTDCASTSETC